MKFITLSQVFTDAIVPIQINLTHIILWRKKLNISSYRNWKAGKPVSEIILTGASVCNIDINVTETVEEINQLIEKA